MGKKKKRGKRRNKRNKELSREEKLVHMAKSRGGRCSSRHKDKKKYNRKKDKFKSSEYFSEDFFIYALDKTLYK